MLRNWRRRREAIFLNFTTKLSVFLLHFQHTEKCHDRKNLRMLFYCSFFSLILFTVQCALCTYDIGFGFWIYTRMNLLNHIYINFHRKKKSWDSHNSYTIRKSRSSLVKKPNLGQRNPMGTRSFPAPKRVKSDFLKFFQKCRQIHHMWSKFYADFKNEVRF